MVVVCADDSGNGVSIQARSYLQLIQRQHKLLQEAEGVRDLTCSDRSLVSDKLVNQPLPLIGSSMNPDVATIAA